MKKEVRKERDWLLVFVGSILLVIGLAVLVLSIIYVGTFGWWSLVFGASGLSSALAAVISIAKNDPSWILLDLIIPG